MEKYTKVSSQGETIYKVVGTKTGKKKLLTIFPGGYRTETPYEFLDFHLMPWGYVEVFENSLSMQVDNGASIWKALHDSEIICQDGKYGCQKDGVLVFPAVADQIEFVEGGKSVFIMKGNRYALLRESGTSIMSEDYNPQNGFFYKDGMMGWRRNGEDFIPAQYDSIEKWWGMEVWRLSRGGDVTYVNNRAELLFTDKRSIEGFESVKDPFPYPTDRGHQIFVTTQFAQPSDIGNNVVLSDCGERYVVDHLTRDTIRYRLLGGSGIMSISEKDLELFDNDFSYEFSAYQARTWSSSPIEDLMNQFYRLGAHSNSWHYLIGLSIPTGHSIPADQIRYLRHYFETLESRTLSLKVSIKEDSSLSEGEVVALMVTHYNERCWPAMFEFDWIDDFNHCTLDELVKKEQKLKASIREQVKKEYREEVYEAQFAVPFYNVRYYSGRSWKESKKVLDWFLGHNPHGADNMDSFVEKIEYFYIRSTVGELEYLYRVLNWALSNGGDPNKIVNGKTCLDRIEETLSCSWEKSGWDTRESISHFNRKIGIIEKCRDLLINRGAKTLAQLYSEESTIPELSEEIMKLRNFCH